MDLVAIVLTIITASTPLLLAATGELITEKSGVLNLGVEGMMLIGAITAFATTTITDSAVLGVLAGAAAGTSLACVFGILVLIFLANQVATGLALTIFGIGLSALVGTGFVGIALEPLPKLDLGPISDCDWSDFVWTGFFSLSFIFYGSACSLFFIKNTLRIDPASCR